MPKITILIDLSVSVSGTEVIQLERTRTQTYTYKQLTMVFFSVSGIKTFYRYIVNSTLLTCVLCSISKTPATIVLIPGLHNY